MTLVILFFTQALIVTAIIIIFMWVLFKIIKRKSKKVTPLYPGWGVPDDSQTPVRM